MMKVLSLCLVAVLCFTSLPVLPAQAAVPKPKGLKITVKKKSSSTASVKCSWKSNSAGHYQFILQYSAPDSSSPGLIRGEGPKMTSHTGTVEMEEGIPYTFVLQVRSYNSKGQTSTIAKKTKSYLLVGSATKKVQNIIKKNITAGMTDFEKVRFVHDWIVKQYVYDSLSSVRTFHEALAGKKAVC